MLTAGTTSTGAVDPLLLPKETALMFFKDFKRANEAISLGGASLAAPNIGVLGSHGAMAIPSLATLMAWGREGLAARIERCIQIAERIADYVSHDDRLELLAPPLSGVLNWRPKDS